MNKYAKAALQHFPKRTSKKRGTDWASSKMSILALGGPAIPQQYWFHSLQLNGPNEYWFQYPLVN
jgi:hypothetical protein